MLHLKRSLDGMLIEVSISEGMWDRLTEYYDVEDALAAFGVHPYAADARWTAPIPVSDSETEFENLRGALRRIFSSEFPAALVFVNDNDRNRVVCINCGATIYWDVDLHAGETWSADELLKARKENIDCDVCATEQTLVLDVEQYATLRQRVAVPEDVIEEAEAVQATAIDDRPCVCNGRGYVELADGFYDVPCSCRINSEATETADD